MSKSLKKTLQAYTDAPDHGEMLVGPYFERYLARTPNILVDDTVAQFVVDELTTPQRNRRMTFSASSRGACAREQVFQFTPVRPAVKPNAELHAIFHHGTFTHLKWQALLLDAGVLDQVEISCVWDKYNLTGTIDGAGKVPGYHRLAADHERFGWELKSINSRGFRWVLEKGPKVQHLLQVHAYMLSTGWRVWSLMYEDKDTQQWKEFVVHFDEDIAQEVEFELMYLNQMVDEKKLPPVLDECSKRQGAYKKCQYAYTCLEQDAWPRPQRRLKLG